MVHLAITEFSHVENDDRDYEKMNQKALLILCTTKLITLRLKEAL